MNRPNQTSSNIEKLSQLFITTIILGIAIAIYIYIFNFNTFSERTMILLSPFWLMPIVFGYYGRLALKMQKRLDQSEHKSMSDMIDFVISSVGFSIIGPFFYLPFKLAKNNQTVMIALAGSLLWGIILLLFLLIIFPML